MGVILTDQRRWAEAAEFLEGASAGYAATLGPLHRDTVLTQSNLIGVLVQTKGAAVALPLARQCATASSKTFGPRHHLHGHILSSLGYCLRMVKQFEPALKALLEAYDIHRESFSVDHPRTRRVAREIFFAYREMDDPKNAAIWKARSDAKGVKHSAKRGAAAAKK